MGLTTPAMGHAHGQNQANSSNNGYGCSECTPCRVLAAWWEAVLTTSLASLLPPGCRQWWREAHAQDGGTPPLAPQEPVERGQCQPLCSILLGPPSLWLIHSSEVCGTVALDIPDLLGDPEGTGGNEITLRPHVRCGKLICWRHHGVDFFLFSAKRRGSS